MSARPTHEEREATIDELLAQARWIAEREDERLSTFAQRASWALGFCGVLAGLVTAQGRETLAQSTELGAAGRVWASVSLGVCMLALITSACFAIAAVWPRSTTDMSSDEVDSFTRDEWKDRPKASHQERMTFVLAQRIRADRASNEARSESVLRAYIALVVAIVALGVYVGAFVLDAINGRENVQTQQAARNHGFRMPVTLDVRDGPAARGAVTVRFRHSRR
jgi:hypothetical protein